MTNKQIREWYRHEVSLIPELDKKWVSDGASLQERAQRAWKIRHDARLRARSMMENPDEVEMLRERDRQLYGDPDGPGFEQLVAEGQAQGFDAEEIFLRIIEGSHRTNPDVDNRFHKDL